MTPKQRFDDFSLMQEFVLDWVDKLSFTENDVLPFIETGNTVAIVAEAFGCKIIWPEGGTARAIEAFKDINKVWQLKPKKIADCQLIRRTFDWIDYAQRKIGTDIGYWTMDLQGPLSVVADIIDLNYV